MSHSLYMLEFPSGKKYIGMSNNPEHRWKLHCWAARRGDGFAVHSAIKKYGERSVIRKILAVGDEQYIADLEVKAISKYETLYPRGYNLTFGGELSPSGMPHVREINRAKRIELWKDPEYRAAMIESATGRKMTAEQNAKNSEAKKKNWQDPGYRSKVVAAHTGKKQSEETIRKRSSAMKDVWDNDPDRGKRHGEFMTGRKFINNGIAQKYLAPGDTLPDGWQYGMLKRPKTC